MRKTILSKAVLGRGRFVRVGRTAPAGGGGGAGGQGAPGGQGGTPPAGSGHGGATPPTGSDGGGQGGATPPAAGGQQPSQQQPAQQPGGQPATGDQPLGEGGLRALSAEREARQAAERQLAAVTKERDDLKSATQTEHERAVTAAKEEGRNEVTQVMNEALVSAKIEAAAATKGFHDPADAAALLAERFGEVPVTSGVPDTAKVTELVDKLATDKPHLIKQAPTTPQFTPIPGHGHQQPPAGQQASLNAGAEAYKAWAGKPST